MKREPRSLVTVLLILILASCQSKEEDFGFTINGKVSNAPDRTLVYIQSKNFIDSTEIFKENFRFKGKLQEPARTVIYLESDLADNYFFWLENSQFSFVGEMDDFRNSTMTGGNNQEARNILLNSKGPIRKSMDSIANVLKKKDLSRSSKDSTLAFYRELVEKKDEIEQKFILQHPTSWEAIYTLNQNKNNWSSEVVKKLFSKMSSELQNSEYGNLIILNGNPQVGDRYIDFEQRNSTGDLQKFSDVMGKYTLLEFWASWCLPCRRNNPKLVRLFNRYSPRGFMVVGISIDEDERKWLKAVKDDELPWVNLTDLKGIQSDPYIIYGVDGIPDNLLLDENGIIIGRNLTPEVLEERMNEIFNVN